MSNGKKEFEDFLKKQESKKVVELNREERKARWIMYVDQLYNDIEIWLNDYVLAGQVQIEKNKILIFEEALGQYLIDELKIYIAGTTANLTPIGTVLIGTIGRVDLSGIKGNTRFILADKHSTGPRIVTKIYSSEEERKKDQELEKSKPKVEPEWVWKITSNPPKIKYSELNSDSFFQSLLGVING